jgi:hypothetical protein
MPNKKDFATSLVVTAPSPATTGTSLVVTSSEGSRYPATPFFAVAHPANELPTLDNAEKVQVTNVTSDTFTIVRAEGDTTAKSIAVGWRISNAVFNEDFTELQHVLAEGAFADGDKDKLDGIEAGADVTDATNVAAAGALMSGGDVDLTGHNITDVNNIYVDSIGGNTDANVTLDMNPHITGNLTTDGTIDGRDVAADGGKLDTIETNADVTDTANVTAAGALMDSEVTNLAAVKAFDPTDYATAAQGATADTALQPGDNISDLTNDSGFTTNTGTVTSVAISGSDGLEVDSGSPVTTSGTIALGVNAANLRTHINVEDGADVTDATNVDAAGAVMNTDTSTASMSFVVDEDNMASDSATKVPTQQSVKAYADTKQPLDSDLTTISGLTATTDNFIQAKSSAWASRTPAQVAADLTHNNLGGLTTGDPHTQYALLAGRSGGQTLIGGTASGNNLLLRSTSDSTKGYISLGDTPSTKVIVGGTSMPLATSAVFGVNNNKTFSSAGDNYGNDFRSLPTFSGTTGGNFTGADFTTLPTASVNMNTITAVSFQSAGSSTGTVTQAIGVTAFATSVGAPTTTATSANVQVGGFAGVVTNGVGVSIVSGQFFGSTTNGTGMYVGNLPGSTSKTAIDVAAQTGATTNIGVRIDKSTLYALQLSSTAGDAASGITFGTDTTLYRSAADTLKTDDALSVTGTLSAAGTIELGHASDTTLSRSSAGVLAVEGVVVPTISSTNTLTNKRVTPRVSTTTSSATPTINTDNVDMYGLTAQTADITSFTTNLSGTPTNGQRLWIYVVGTGARAITWGASFEAGAVALPTTTVTTQRLDVGFIWNSVTSKWRCMASGSA